MGKGKKQALIAAGRGQRRGGRQDASRLNGLKNEGILADLEFESTLSLAKTFGPYLELQAIAQSSKERQVREALEARPKMSPREREELYRELYKDDAPLWETIVFSSRSERASADRAVEGAPLPFGEATTEAYREAARRGEWTEVRVSTNGAVQWRSHLVKRDSRDEYFGYGVRFASVRACLENDENAATAVFVTGRLAVVDWHLSRIVGKLLFTQQLADDRLNLIDLADVQEQLDRLRDLLKESQPVLERLVPTRTIFDAIEQELCAIMRTILQNAAPARRLTTTSAAPLAITTTTDAATLSASSDDGYGSGSSQTPRLDPR